MIDSRLEKIKKMSPEELGSSATFGLIEKLADEYAIGSQIGEAKELWQFLTKNLIAGKTDEEKKAVGHHYQPLLIKLGWVACPFISESEIENLFKSSLLVAIDLEIDLVDKAKSFIGLVFGDLRLATQRRNLLVFALKANEEELGTRTLKIENLNLELPPQIKNWLKDYDQSTQTPQRKERLSLLEYINTSKNISQLSEEKKLILRQIFELYDFLRFLTSEENVEATSHQLPEEIALPKEKEDLSKFITTQTETKSSMEQEVLAAYQGDPRQLKAVASEQEKVTKKFGDDKAKLRVEFFTAVQNKNVVRTIAILRILAGLADLENFIKEDEKLNKFLAVTWAKRYGDEFAAEFAKNPAQIQFIRLFLRYVLEERLGLSASDAARVGLQIANIFVSLGKIDYNKMAYFDVGKKSFEWFEG
ncbi:MAG: hypothetical protein WCX08_04495 [Candidatus Buchananbacteria bacterium]